MKKYIFLLIPLLFGCELVVDVDVPYEKGLTLNSFFTPDSTFTVQLAANRYVLDNKDFQKIENGVVKIYEDDQYIETLIHLGKGKYKSPSRKPVVGKSYKVSAEVENLGTVASKSIIPSPVQISSVEFQREAGSYNAPPKTTFHLKFEDPQGVSNYYQILLSAAQIYVNPSGEEKIIWYPVHVESNDPTINGESGENTNNLVFKDILFDGKTADLTFETHFSVFQSLKVSVRSLSEDYYKYLTTLELQNSTSGDPFAQPINVYNNIKDGYGIFAGYSESVYEYSLPKSTITGINPAKGKPGDHIFITGENFEFNNYLWVVFRGSQLDIYLYPVSITPNQLEVIVPQNAVSGPIKIYSATGVTTSSISFEIVN
jgi:hypothetical protein